jgi:predicted signal transduction protein with EAL and GGDEF domain
MPAKGAAERIREMVQKALRSIGSEQLALTVSVGVAEASAQSPSLEAVLRNADRALYEAKRTGRNKVCAVRPAPAFRLQSEAVSASKLLPLSPDWPFADTWIIPT